MRKVFFTNTPPIGKAVNCVSRAAGEGGAGVTVELGLGTNKQTQCKLTCTLDSLDEFKVLCG